MTINWTLSRLSQSGNLAVSLPEAKAHLRTSGTAQDPMIQDLIQAATEQLERDTNRAIIAGSWKQTQDCFPESGLAIPLYLDHVTSITSIYYLDDDGVSTLLDPANYEYDSGRNAITCLDDDNGWPETLATTSGRDTVTITFAAGAADSGCVPRLAKQAILLEVGRWYFDPAQENGVNTNDGRSYDAIVKKLLSTKYA